MESISLTSPDISCAHCQTIIERALATLPGVESVSVDIPTRQIHVSYDATQLSRQAIVAKLDDEGYPIAS